MEKEKEVIEKADIEIKRNVYLLLLLSLLGTAVLSLECLLFIGS